MLKIKSIRRNSKSLALASASADAIFVAMALAALKEAAERFADVPPPLRIATVPPSATDPWNNIARQVREYDRRMAEWRAGLLVVQTTLWDDFTKLPEIMNSEQLITVLESLSEFTRVVDSDIQENRRAIFDSEITLDQAVAEVAKKSARNAKFTRRQLRSLIETEKETYQARVRFYYFLLSLHAELDPQSRGGPAFSDPDAFESYLRKQT
jgi:hypothetical protein